MEIILNKIKKGDNSPITNGNENPIRKCKWKFNLKIEIEVHLDLERKFMKITKIDKWRIKKLLENRNENENPIWKWK